MPTAIVAVHFGPSHAVAAIDGLADAALGRLEEAGPASTALEFAIGNEQLLSASRTRERPWAMLPQKGARARCLGGVITEHRVLLRRQLPPPFLIRLDDGKCRVLHVPQYASTAPGRTLPVRRFLSPRERRVRGFRARFLRFAPDSHRLRLALELLSCTAGVR